MKLGPRRYLEDLWGRERKQEELLRELYEESRLQIDLKFRDQDIAFENWLIDLKREEDRRNAPVTEMEEETGNAIINEVMYDPLTGTIFSADMKTLRAEAYGWTEETKTEAMDIEHGEYCTDGDSGDDDRICDREWVWSAEDEDDIQQYAEQAYRWHEERRGNRQNEKDKRIKAKRKGRKCKDR